MGIGLRRQLHHLSGYRSLTVKSIIEDIKSQSFKQIYLFYGPEAYLKNQYKIKLKEALAGGDDDMNFSRYTGKGISESEIIDLAETMPFLAERRVILIEGSGFFKNKADKLADYIPSMPEYAHLLFVEDEVDKRSRMYKAVKKAGRVIEFVAQDSATLGRWVLGRLNEAKKKITRADLELFFSMVGNDMSNIENELEKLICYTAEKDSVSSHDIMEIVTPQISNHIFDMIRAVTEKRQRDALLLYHDLLALKEPPLRILALLSREFNMLLQVKSMGERGYQVGEIAEKTGLRDFAVRKYQPVASRYRLVTLNKALDDCVSAECDVKTGRITDMMSVELLLIKYSKIS